MSKIKYVLRVLTKIGMPAIKSRTSFLASIDTIRYPAWKPYGTGMSFVFLGEGIISGYQGGAWKTWRGSGV